MRESYDIIEFNGRCFLVKQEVKTFAGTYDIMRVHNKYERLIDDSDINIEERERQAIVSELVSNLVCDSMETVEITEL